MPPEATLTIPDGALNVLSYGAKGDGVTDDSAAIARAQAALTPGGTLVLPKGMVFAHSTVLKFTVANTRITGGGTLLATNPLNSAVWIDANTVTLDHLAINTVTSTNRYAEYERQGIRVLNRTGTTISDVSVTGPAAAGIYISRSSQFTLARVRVTNSLADAIHITGGSHDATLTDIAVTGSGDDGIAVVSLANGDPAVANITVTNASVTNQRWGRAFSVVGGNAITWRNIYSEKSNAAAIYIAAESEWQTQAVTNVLVDGATIVSANTNSTVDHGAILLYNSLSGATNTGINLNNITIKDTRTTASRQVSILDGTQQKILMTNFTITGGPTTTFGSNLPTTSYATKWWTYNGTALADRVGW